MVEDGDPNVIGPWIDVRGVQRSTFNLCQAAVIPYHQIMVAVVGSYNSVNESVVFGRDLREVLLCVGERTLQKFLVSKCVTAVAPGLMEEISRLFHRQTVR